MSEKKLYYVQVEPRYINPTPSPDQPAEFEIEATYEEMLELKELFHRQEKAGSRSAEYHFEAPFQEEKTEKRKSEYDEYMEEIYRKIYQLGTPQTRKGLAESGIMPEEDFKK